MRWQLFALAIFTLALGGGTQALGQADPNQPAPDPQAFIQQLRDNMNNAGVTPRDLIQQAGQQMQNGTFDPQAFGQQLQQQGIINQGMLDQLNQMRNQAQNFNQQRQMTTLQQQLNASDEEWGVLGPRIQRILDLTNDLGQANGNVAVRAGVGAAQASAGPVAKALAELKAALQDENAAEAEVTAKLTAYRGVRQRALAELSSARQDLLGVVTLRQEAILLNLTILD